MRKSFGLLAGGCALASVLLLSACAAEKTSPAAVRVMLESGNGFRITGENPLTVAPGADAVFSVELEEGAVCIQTTPGTVFDAAAKTLTVPSVQYPQTVTLRTSENAKPVRFFLEHAGDGGYIGADIEQGLVYTGSVARVYVRTKPGYRFDGWSLRRPLAKGGALVSDAETFDYTVTEDTFLYANFTRTSAEVIHVEVPDESVLITYDLNGGTYAGTSVTAVPEETPLYHIYPNCPYVDGSFVRDGYQLIEYNTEPDGTGDAYSPGAKIILPAGCEELRLYCIWAEESDASLFRVADDGAGGVAVTGYSGAESTLVIPEKIGGRTVTAVRTGAFTDAPFETVVIPRTVRTVESGAFGCTGAFRTLYIFDTIRSIPDDAFTDVSGFSDFRLGAARPPVYTNSVEGCFGEKWERVVSSEKPRLVVVSGSSSLYGLNAAMLQALVGEDYTVVNYGTNAGTSSVFYLEMLSHYLREGDIVVHAPEVGGSTMGSTEITWRLFRGTEYYYNAWRDVDMRRYSHLFRSLTEHAEITGSMTPLNYTLRAVSLNEYGDIENTTAYQADDYHGGADIHLYPGVISGRNREELNRAYDRLTEMGVRVYMSCAPCNENAINPAFRTEAARAAYMQALRDSVNVPVISDIGDYILRGELMYNSDYHPNAWGRDMRTEQLFADLTKQLASEGIVLGDAEK